MRLLKDNSDGTFSLTEFVGSGIPRYAILSHTWGADSDEVSFKDLVEGTGNIKAGYNKIRFCGERARDDGIRYFWVDTCCIDKSSSAELTEAINSMFQWYRNAAKCYVFLTDVSKHDGDANNRDSRLRKSRWFTRGWTLQELIASPSVEFFSLEGERLGDKKSLERQLHEITRIAIQAFRGSPLSEFSVDERMSWIANRRTKREEDKAYSLLGIFDVHMPLIYGEGERNAFRRLRGEINRYSNNYQHDEPPIDPRRLSYSPVRVEKPNTTPRIMPFSTVPFSRDPEFVDRPEILEWIHKKLAEPAARAALFGLGGLGFVK
jgi:hypothetical protein